MDNSSKKAILTTLAYYDIFDYPLQALEIQKYFLGERSLSVSEITTFNIPHKNGLYYLPGREMIVAKRIQKQKINLWKKQFALKTSKVFAWIPTILYIGISGSVAMENANAEDDIDLFIITQSHTVWITRMLVVLISILAHNKRQYGTINTKNKFCFNMWLDVDHMAFQDSRQNVYTAHEIVQLKTIVNKNKTYEKFVGANNWIRKFLPHTKIIFVKKPSEINFWYIFYPLNSILGWVQKSYMKSHRTTETVENGFLAFHPEDYTDTILTQFTKRLKKYEI